MHLYILRVGVVEIKIDNSENLRFLIDGGFADVALNKVTLLAERSFNLKDSSKEEFKEAINDVNKRLEGSDDSLEKESLLLKKQILESNS